VAGLSADELNARPAGGQTNSIVIVAHALGATLSWMSLGLGKPLPARDREAEFRSVAGSNFAAWTEERIHAIVGVFDGATWDPARMGTPNWNVHSKSEPRTAAYAVAHGLAHLGEHVGHLHMTRELLRPTAD